MPTSLIGSVAPIWPGGDPDAEPLFLDVDTVDALHEEQIARFGGSRGVRDAGLVESAVNAPRFAWQYERGDLFDVAAVYLVHLARNHAYVDGNKRTALHAALTFLDVNGIDVGHDSVRMEEAVIACAKGARGVLAMARDLRQLCGYPTGLAD